MHVPAIMAKAAEFRDQLHVAYEAAELMLLEVDTSALGLQDGRAVNAAEWLRSPRLSRTRSRFENSQTR